VQRARLLTIAGRFSDRGAAPLEAIFAIVFLLLLALGVIEVALALYGRKVAISSAHEGARAAIELGRSPQEGAVMAERTVQRAAGHLVDDLRVSVSTERSGLDEVVLVHVSGRLAAPGPIPLPLAVDVVARAVKPGDVP
jgi:TadE-like protein